MGQELVVVLAVFQPRDQDPAGVPDMHVWLQKVADTSYGYFTGRKRSKHKPQLCWGLWPLKVLGLNPNEGSFSLLIKLSLQITLRVRLKRLLHGFKVYKICTINSSISYFNYASL